MGKSTMGGAIGTYSTAAAAMPLLSEFRQKNRFCRTMFLYKFSKMSQRFILLI